MSRHSHYNGWDKQSQPSVSSSVKWRDSCLIAVTSGSLNSYFIKVTSKGINTQQMRPTAHGPAPWFVHHWFVRFNCLLIHGQEVAKQSIRNVRKDKAAVMLTEHTCEACPGVFHTVAHAVLTSALWHWPHFTSLHGGCREPGRSHTSALDFWHHLWALFGFYFAFYLLLLEALPIAFTHRNTLPWIFILHTFWIDQHHIQLLFQLNVKF